MSYEFGDNPSSWLDAALRDVPLPADLIARLRRLGVDNDRELDRVLRQVTVPLALQQQLKQIPDDVELDHRLRKVAVGAGLLVRLKAIPSKQANLAATAFAASEPAAAAASAPRYEAARANEQRARQPSTWRAAAWIVAASIAAVVTLGVWNVFSDRQNPTPVDSDLSPLLVLGAPILPGDGPSLADPAIDFESMDAPPSLAATSPEILQRRLRSPSVLRGGSLSVLNEAERIAARSWMDSRLHVSAMPEHLQASRPLALVANDRTPGWAPTAARGFDWSARFLDGVNPFVALSDDDQRRHVHVPLSTQTNSYRNFLLRLGAGEQIAAQDIRTEEFLAAVDYHFPLPRDAALALYASGGPSPWDPVGRQLLLLGVQARASQAALRDPVEMTLVVDASLASPGADAFAACREAMGRMAGALEDGDRVSIILAAQRPVPLAQGLGLQDAEELAAAIEQIGPQQIVDVVPAIEAALGRAGRIDGTRRRLVVCLTSDLGHIALSEQQRLGGLVASAARRGVRFEVVRIAPWDQPDAASAELAARGAGAAHHATGQSDLWAILYRLLTGDSPVAAQNVALSIEFDPRVVERYRVIGHDSQSIRPGDAGDMQGVELLSGQSSVAMLELKLKGGASGTVGTAYLTWRDPQTDGVGEAVQRVSTAQFATTPAESALPLQRATVAAMTAEVLRRIKYVPADAGLGDVLELADTLDGRLWDERWFVGLVDAIESALAPARPSRSRLRQR